MGKTKRTMPVKGIAFVKANEDLSDAEADAEIPKPGQKTIWKIKEPSEEEDDQDDEAPEEDPEEVEPEVKKEKKRSRDESDNAEAEADLEQVELDRLKKERKQKKKEARAQAEAEEAELEASNKEKSKKRKEQDIEPEANFEDLEEAAEDAQRRKKAEKKRKKRQEQANGAAWTGQEQGKDKTEQADDATPKENDAKEIKQDTLFVSGIPWSCDEDRLRQDFSQCGTIKFMNFVLNPQGKPKGIAFITFKGGHGVDEAIQKFDGLEYGGRTLSVKRADKPTGAKGKGKGKGKGGRGTDQGNKGFEVWLCGLPFNTDEKVLRKDFEECGEIVSLNMLKKPDGSCRGVAFITYKTMEAVDKACEYNSTDYGGRWIQVEKSGESKGASKGSATPGKGDGGKRKSEQIQDTKAAKDGSTKKTTFGPDEDE